MGLGKGLQAEGLSPSKRTPASVPTSSSQWQEALHVPPGKEWRICESYTVCARGSYPCELRCGFGSECWPGQYVEWAVPPCYLCMFLSLSVCLSGCLLESETSHLPFPPPGRLFLTQPRGPLPHLLQSENIMFAFPRYSSPSSCVLVSWLP